MPKLKSKRRSVKPKRYAESSDWDSESDLLLSSECEESCKEQPKVTRTVAKEQVPLKPIDLLNPNSFDEWIKKLYEYDDANLGFLKILQEIQHNILKRIDILEKSLITFSRSNPNQGSPNTNDSEKMYFSDKVASYKEILNTQLPIDDINTFIKFDRDLIDDTNKRETLRKYLEFLTAGSHYLSMDVNTMMTAILTKPVQQCYSGAGRIYQGRKRRNFSLTNFFQCMQDILIDKYNKQINEIQLTTRISRWLSSRNYYES